LLENQRRCFRTCCEPGAVPFVQQGRS
jgi:hypothetical protein